MPEDTEAEFPKNFMWGASTASHQVEGGTHNQWSVWEQANAERLAKAARPELEIGHTTPIWDEVKHLAKDPKNYISGEGVDHYHLYKQDFDLLKKLNLNAFRFGIEWSRIEPSEGQWNEQEVEHYRNYIKELRKRNIEPVLNLWHWTHPIWFEEKGAFKSSKNIKYFLRFVSKVMEEYGADVKWVITINEPNVYSGASYFLGIWPPQNKNLLSMLRVWWNLAKAHKKSYKIIKNFNPNISVGIANNLANIQAKDPHDFLDEFSTKIMRYYWNWWFYNRIRNFQDFVGINYYLTDYYDGWFHMQSPKVPQSDVGWYMEPEGLYPLLLRAWSHYKKPILITENGVADYKDEYRRWWIEETIVAMERAISQGVVIKGYFHWSLLDNFEWNKGWWPKFGLVEVDRENGMKRTIRPSAKWYAERISKLTVPK